MDLPELYLRKPQEELYANMGKTEEQIKSLMQKDKKLTNLKLKSDPSRDISHLRDKIPKSKKVPPLPLPTDLSNLRSLMHSSNSKGIQITVSPSGISHLTCTHKDCIERVASQYTSRRILSKSSSRKLSSLNSSPALEHLPNIDREFLGSPTGHQEIESLGIWFNTMKTQCEDDESTEVVYTMCARELLRQVSVQSALRGKVLQEVIEMQPKVFGKKWEKLNAEFNRFREEQEERMKNVEEKWMEEVDKREKEIERLGRAIREMEGIRMGLDESNVEYKRNLWALQQKYLNCEEMWKERLLMYMEEVQKLRKLSSTTGRKMVERNRVRLKTRGKFEDDANFQLFIENLSRITEDAQEIDNPASNLLVNYPVSNLNIQQIDRISIIPGEHSLKYLEQSLKFSQVPLEEAKSSPNTDSVQYLSLNAEKKSPSNSVHIDAALLPTNPQAEELCIPIPESVPMLVNEDNLPDNPQNYEDANLILDLATKDPILLVPTDINSPQTTDFSVSLPERFQDTQFEDKINEAPSYFEESRENNSMDAFNGDQETPPFLNAQVQTEDILFERYLSALKNVEEVVANAKPEEIQQIQLALQTLLIKSDPIVTINEPIRRVSLKRPQKSTPRKRSNSETGNELSEAVHKLADSATPDASRPSSPIVLKSPKQQVSDFLASVQYLSSSYVSKQKEISKLDQRIDEKCKMLRLISKPKVNIRQEQTFEDQSIRDRRASEPFTQNSVNKSRILRKITESNIQANDNAPWDEGYEIGFGDGKIHGYLNAIQKIRDSDNYPETDDADTQDRPFSHKKVDKFKIFTRFMEFNFHIPAKAKPRKIHPAGLILERFLARPLEKIKMRSTLSRKNINRMLFVIYNSAVGKMTAEGGLTLAEVTYDEFYGRYGLKSVCNKRFLEFVASAICNCEHKRCLMYIRLLRAGETIFSFNYSKPTLWLYLTCFQYINTSKLGIHFFTEDEDKIMVPTLRVLDCAKEKLDAIADKTVASAVLSKIEQKSIPDPKKINSGGLVEMEVSLEIIADAYENYINSIWKGMNLCLKAMGQHNKPSVLVLDLLIIARTFNKTCKETENEIGIEEMYNFCIKNSVASEQEVIKFTPNMSKEELFHEVIRNKERIFKFAEENEVKENSFDMNLWRIRIEIIEINMEKELFLANLAWKMYKNEICRLAGDNFFSNN